MQALQLYRRLTGQGSCIVRRGLGIRPLTLYLYSLEELLDRSELSKLTLPFFDTAFSVRSAKTDGKRQKIEYSYKINIQ